MSFPARLLLVAALHFALPAAAGEAPYLTASQVDLLRLLPPPPKAGSAQADAEMAEVLALQASRSPERTAQALADQAEGVFDIFGATLGPLFTATSLPMTTRLFGRIGDTDEAVLGAAKDGFARQRPFLANPAVQTPLRRSRSGSYPSGHATRATMTAIVLAALVPEQREAIFGRVPSYIESRVIGGMHFRSDVVAGRLAGTAIAAVLMNDPGFVADFDAARRELRPALGLTP